MNLFLNTAVAALSTGLSVAPAMANDVAIEGGQTSVVLNFDALAAAASLELSGVSADVIAPGSLDGSVAFGITSRDADDLPTTFAYDATDFFGSFGGTIEHRGSVFFNDGTVEVGNFTIGFDAARAGTLDGNASGFYVESTTGVSAILFDVANPSTLFASSLEAVVGADLLVSPEFAGFLLSIEFAEGDLSGVAVGEALVQGDTGCSAADFNDDGYLNFIDIFAFVRAAVKQKPSADLDGSGMFELNDIQQFVERYISCR